MFATGFFSILVGRFIDVHNHKEKILVLSYFLNSIFTFGYILVQKPFDLFIIQAGLGFCLALSNPIWYSLYSEYVKPDKQGSAWGLFDGLGKIVTGVAILVGGIIVKNYSFEVLFLTMGSVQLLAAIYQAKILFNH